MPNGTACPGETDALLELMTAVFPDGNQSDWTGDACSSDPSWSHVVTAYGEVLAIDLGDLGLSGSIPESLFTVITSLTVGSPSFVLAGVCMSARQC